MKREYDLAQFDHAKLLEEITNEDIKGKIYAIIPKGEKIEVYLSQNLTSEEDTELAAVIAAHDGTPVAPLRVHRVLPKDSDPLISDFSILGFRKMAPYYDRGRKDRAIYMCVTKEEIIVEKVFRDIRDESGRLTDLEITFNWYRDDDTIGLTKTEIAKSFNKAESKTEERKRRERQLDFLLAEGEGSAAEPILDDIFAHYYDQILHYKEDGSSVLADALNNEQDSQISFYLTIRVPFSADPENFTVPIKEAILYQIGALDEAGLMTSLQPVQS